MSKLINNSVIFANGTLLERVSRAGVVIEKHSGGI